MFSVLILICSTALQPVDCQRETAIDVIAGPEAANEVACGLLSQAYVAETALGDLPPDAYLKIQCTRTSIGGANVG